MVPRSDDVGAEVQLVGASLHRDVLVDGPVPALEVAQMIGVDTEEPMGNFLILEPLVCDLSNAACCSPDFVSVLNHHRGHLGETQCQTCLDGSQRDACSYGNLPLT